MCLIRFEYFITVLFLEKKIKVYRAWGVKLAIVNFILETEEINEQEHWAALKFWSKLLNLIENSIKSEDKDQRTRLICSQWCVLLRTCHLKTCTFTIENNLKCQNNGGGEILSDLDCVHTSDNWHFLQRSEMHRCGRATLISFFYGESGAGLEPRHFSSSLVQLHKLETFWSLLSDSQDYSPFLPQPKKSFLEWSNS